LIDSSDARPSGSSIGRALLVRPSPLNQDLIAAVRAVESVHGDGPLPAIPLRFGQFPPGVEARFWFNPDGPISIEVNRTRRHVRFATVHEIGHFIDHSGIAEPSRFASEASEELADWRIAVKRSRQVQLLERAIGLILSDVSEDVAARYRAYLDPTELWARSYAQFVTVRADDPALRPGLNALRIDDGTSPGRIEHLLHWENADFAPIEAAIEAAFRRLGWRSKR
jgi:hypothetical protein